LNEEIANSARVLLSVKGDRKSVVNRLRDIVIARGFLYRSADKIQAALISSAPGSAKTGTLP
jgi:hypothetical protein